MSRCYVALGSNLEDRCSNLDRALAMIGTLPQTTVVAVSPFIETAPVGGPPESPDYLNAVAAIETELAPKELLEALLTVEHKLGRIRAERWGPRTIDLDLLLYDEVFRDAEKEPGIEFMEIWPRHYILTVLRADRPGAVCSRIWVSRKTLMVTHHQLFDADGTILAEARFANYAHFAARGGEGVTLPTRAIFIWPREELVLDITLAQVSVNKALEPRVFRRPSERGADVQTIYPRLQRLEESSAAAPPSAPGSGAPAR